MEHGPMEHGMTAAVPRRHNPAGGYARGEQTRQRIVAAALDVFGAAGFEGASTRQIAQRAGVNPPALQYYFSGKEGLHLACADHVAARGLEALLPSYLAAARVPDEGTPAAALCDILDALADFLFGAGQVAEWSRFLARGQSEGAGPAYRVLKQKLGGRLFAECSRLVGIARARAPEEAEIKLETMLLLGGISIFHLSRPNALATLGWPDFGGERLGLLKAVVRRQVMAVL